MMGFYPSFTQLKWVLPSFWAESGIKCAQWEVISCWPLVAIGTRERRQRWPKMATMKGTTPAESSEQRLPGFDLSSVERTRPSHQLKKAPTFKGEDIWFECRVFFSAFFFFATQRSTVDQATNVQILLLFFLLVVLCLLASTCNELWTSNNGPGHWYLGLNGASALNLPRNN